MATTDTLVCEWHSWSFISIAELSFWVTQLGFPLLLQSLVFEWHSWGFHYYYRPWFVSDVTLWFQCLRCSRMKDGVALSVDRTFTCSARQTKEPLLVPRICKAHHILQNLIVPQMVKISPDVFHYHIHWSILWIRWMQSAHSHTWLLEDNSNIILHFTCRSYKFIAYTQSLMTSAHCRLLTL
jgi:hypothetical protein